MRVLFVNPHYTHDPFTLLLHPPLAYAYMTAVLRQSGHEVVHVDLPFEGNCVAALDRWLDDVRPDVVGVTSVAQSYFHALEIARRVKEHSPGVKVLFGGPHATFVARECLERHAAVDYVLSYDAEYSLRDLADALAQGAADEAMRRIPGLAFRSGAAIVESDAEPPLRDLDLLPAPDRSIFDMRRYLDYDYETVVMTARGCPSRCTFCSTTQIGRKYRWHGAAHVCDEVEEVLDMGFSSVFFGDDTFSGNTPRVLEICREIRRRRLSFPWTSNMRAIDARPDVLDAMREAGAYRVFMGFESIQNATLKMVKKGATPEKLYRVAQLVKSHGLELHTSFIIGAPGDTHESLAETLDFIRVIAPTVATFNVMEPRPGTDVYHNPSRYGIEIPDPYWYETTSWLRSPVCATETLTADEIGDWVARCYFEFCSAEFMADENLQRIEDVRAQWDRDTTRPKLAVVQ